MLRRFRRHHGLRIVFQVWATWSESLMFWRLVVEFPSDQEICQASLEGGYLRKRIGIIGKMP